MAYWTYFESTTGQSIGKKLLFLKTTDFSGKRIDAKNAAIEDFGKAFLNPLDIVLGTSVVSPEEGFKIFGIRFLMGGIVSISLAFIAKYFILIKYVWPNQYYCDHIQNKYFLISRVRKAVTKMRWSASNGNVIR